MNQPEGLQFVKQSMRVGRGLRLLVGVQSLSEEGDDVVFGSGRLEEQLEDCKCRGVQQVGVP